MLRISTRIIFESQIPRAVVPRDKQCHHRVLIGYLDQKMFRRLCIADLGRAIFILSHRKIKCAFKMEGNLESQLAALIFSLIHRTTADFPRCDDRGEIRILPLSTNPGLWPCLPRIGSGEKGVTESEKQGIETPRGGYLRPRPLNRKTPTSDWILLTSLM